ncbi:MAG: hypothetical protein Kow00108_25390 [Calditrichia bacterium]
MKKVLLGVLVLVFGIQLAFGQISRQAQKEAFLGFAIPLGPEGFKDYYKVGISPHFQYVIFPSQQIGVSFGAAYEFFTFDGDKFLEDYGNFFGVDVSDLTVDGSFSNLELGVGIRPYITSPEAANQLFVFGMLTYNFMHFESTVTDPLGTEYSDKSDDNKMGLGFGGGLEMPMTDRFNLIVQGVFRVIFTKDDNTGDENTTFLGVTAGIVF